MDIYFQTCLPSRLWLVIPAHTSIVVSYNTVSTVYSTYSSGAYKKKPKLRVTGLQEGNSPVIGEFPARRASYAENVSIWWRHHFHRLYSNVNVRCGTTLTIHSFWKPSRKSSIFPYLFQDDNTIWKNNKYLDGSWVQPVTIVYVHGCWS